MMTCPICQSTHIKTGHLGSSPVTGYVCAEHDDSIAQPIFNFEINLCEECNALFQSKQMGADEILKKMYLQHEATIRTSKQYEEYYEKFSKRVAAVANAFNKNANVLEIGCNDGLLLEMIGNKSRAKLFGIEPSVIFSEQWVKRKIIGTNVFFGSATATELVNKYNSMDIIVARHVLEHISNPYDFFEGLSILCNKTSVVLIEVPYLKTILEANRFENVNYSHLIHYSIKSMASIARKFNFKIKKFDLCEIDGGSIVFELVSYDADVESQMPFETAESDLTDTFIDFLAKFEKSKVDLWHFLDLHKERKYIGFGAGAKGQYLIHLYGLDKLDLKVIDETPGYEGKFIPGTKIEIVGIDYLNENIDPIVINLAPTHKEAVRAKIPYNLSYLDPVNMVFPNL